MISRYSWKTSIGGLGSGLAGAVLAIIALVRAINSGELDERTLESGIAGIGFLASAIIGLSARDDNLTSEQVGAGGRGKA